MKWIQRIAARVDVGTGLILIAQALSVGAITLVILWLDSRYVRQITFDSFKENYRKDELQHVENYTALIQSKLLFTKLLDDLNQNRIDHEGRLRRLEYLKK